jgi:hypothetical protein
MVSEYWIYVNSTSTVFKTNMIKKFYKDGLICMNVIVCQEMAYYS